MVTLALLLNRLYGPLTALATVRLDVVTAVVSFDRIFEVLDVEPLIAEPEHPVALPPGPVSVVFHDVRFHYPSADQVSLASLEEVAVLDERAGAEVLHGVSFAVEAGRTVAVVGASGAGKSTIASLVPVLYDADTGSVHARWRQRARPVVRDAAPQRRCGHPGRPPVPRQHRRQPALRRARPDRRRHLGGARRRLRLADLVRSLPDELDTVIGERGYRLSGGERQRLTLARVLLAQPRVVILDEATAHLDVESEAAVQAALAVALEGRTALVIAHRLSTIRAADEILVVDAGMIVERGTHHALLAAGGRYADLYRTQFADDVLDDSGRRRPERVVGRVADTRSTVKRSRRLRYGPRS